MSLEELKFLSDDLIKNFVNEIGYDGEEYIKISCIPYINLVNNIYDGVGETITGTFYEKDMDDDITKIRLDNSLNQKEEESIRERGYIKLINKDVYDNEDLITLIHERFHINRNVIAIDPSKTSIYAYDELKNDGTTTTHLFQFNDNYDRLQGDFSQNFLKGNFDTSKKNLISVLKEYKTNIERSNIEKHSKYKLSKILGYQKNVDETLIELMSLLCYKLYKYPSRNIMEILQKISSISVDELEDIQNKRIVYLSKIIVLHDDLELFKWMINPIDYTIGNNKYDYFKEYTKNDPKEWLNVFEKTKDEIEIFDYDIMNYFIDMENKKIFMK